MRESASFREADGANVTHRLGRAVCTFAAAISPSHVNDEWAQIVLSFNTSHAPVVPSHHSDGPQNKNARSRRANGMGFADGGDTTEIREAMMQPI